MGLIDDIRASGYRGGGDAPVVTSGVRPSAVAVATRLRAGAELLPEVRDFMSAAQGASDAELAAMVRDEPPAVDQRADALLAGIAEHLLALRGLPSPAWTADAGRVLDRFWFVSDLPGLRAVALAQSPVALKRHGIFWPARSLERV